MGAMKRALRVFALASLALLAAAAGLRAQDVPELTQPVDDFAHVIDPAHTESMERTIRALQAATGDVVVVATIDTYAPFGSLEQYANRLFENHGRGIGEKGKDNGVLITVAVKEHKVWIEVGYGLEPYITDGFAGETARLYMIPEFRRNDYGTGLEAGLQRIVGRIAQARNVTLEGVPSVAPEPRRRRSGGTSALGIILFIVIFLVFGILSAVARAASGPRRWGRGPWSGWNSGIGPFGGGWGGFGGGFGGFGGGGGSGFGGFGGGASGGGGGGGGW
jgi:uncharacterized protein